MNKLNIIAVRCTGRTTDLYPWPRQLWGCQGKAGYVLQDGG